MRGVVFVGRLFFPDKDLVIPQSAGVVRLRCGSLVSVCLMVHVVRPSCLASRDLLHCCLQRGRLRIDIENATANDFMRRFAFVSWIVCIGLARVTRVGDRASTPPYMGAPFSKLECSSFRFVYFTGGGANCAPVIGWRGERNRGTL